MDRTIRAVIDTTVPVLGQFWHGSPHLLLTHVRNQDVTLIFSPTMLAEFDGVIGRPTFQKTLAGTGRPQERVLAELRYLPEIVIAPPLAGSVCRDSGDDKLLLLAVAGKADLIISGDDDLLNLAAYQIIRIVRPAKALADIAAATIRAKR